MVFILNVITRALQVSECGVMNVVLYFLDKFILGLKIDRLVSK